MRRVVVHTPKRGKRLSRYSHITWAYRELKKIERLSLEEQAKVIDTHLTELLANYSPMRIAEIIRIWFNSEKVWPSPLQIKNFDQLHRRCGSIFVSASISSTGKGFFLEAKNKVEFITRTRINRPDMKQLIRDYLNTEVGYSPMSEAEYVELQFHIQKHLRELKFNPKLSDITFTLTAWRLKNTLARVYGVDLPD